MNSALQGEAVVTVYGETLSGSVPKLKGKMMRQATCRPPRLSLKGCAMGRLFEPIM